MGSSYNKIGLLYYENNCQKEKVLYHLLPCSIACDWHIQLKKLLPNFNLKCLIDFDPPHNAFAESG